MAGKKGVKVSQAIVTVIPSFEGARGKISDGMKKALVPVLKELGVYTGEEFGEKLGDGVKKNKKSISDSVKESIEPAAKESGEKGGKDIGEKLAEGVKKSKSKVSKTTQESVEDGADKGGKSAAKKIVQSLSDSANKVKTKFNTVMDGVKSNKFVSTVTSGFSTIRSKLKSVMDKAADESGESAGSKLGSKISEGLSTAKVAIGNMIANIATSALTTIGSAIKDTFTTAFNNYGDYQQLVGGVETLFKDSAGIVQDYAKNAYKTAGLSANEYMETVTGFSASLISSLGGDTAKAAEVANLALVDMSDNANKMGTDMESIQFAYQGFAKQNYTMLDNLKLGYGGTKTEMQRLLNDAKNLKAAQGEMVDYSIDSFADVVEAIHVVQDNLDITGTTAKEAGTTIQGSFGMVKAAWDNWLTGLADPNADMKQLSANLVESLHTALDNALPAVKQMLSGFWEGALSVLDDVGLGGVADLMRGIADALNSERVQEALGKITDYGSRLLDYFGKLAGELAPSIEDIVGLVTDGIGGILDIGYDLMSFFEGVNIITPIVEGLGSAFTSIKDALSNAWPYIEQIVETVSGTLGLVLSDVASVLGKMAETIGVVAGAVIEKLAPVLAPMMDDLSNVLVDMSASLADLINGALQWIIDHSDEIASVIAAMVQGLIDLVNWFQNDPLGQKIVEIVSGVVETIGGILETLVGLVKTAFGLIVGIATGDFSTMEEGLGDTLNGIVDSFGGTWDTIGGLVKTAGELIVRVVDAIGGLLTGASDIIAHFGEYVGQVFFDVYTGISNALGQMGHDAADALANLVTDASNALGQLGYDIAAGIAGMLNDISNFFASAGYDLAAGIAGLLTDISNFFMNVGYDLAKALGDIGEQIIQFFSDLPGRIWDFISGIPDMIASMFSQVHIPTLHVEGGFDFVNGEVKLPSISFYAEGGWVDKASVINVAGERGTEAVLSDRGRFTKNFAADVAKNLDNKGGDTYLVIDGAKVNADEDIEDKFYELMMAIKRKAGMYSGSAI